MNNQQFNTLISFLVVLSLKISHTFTG